MSAKLALLKALTVLSKNFGREIDKDQLAIYEQVLGGLDEIQVQRMLSTALTGDLEFMPRAGQLLSFGIRGHVTPKAEAETEFNRLTRALHEDRTKELSDRTRRVALSFGSFTDLQAMHSPQWSFMRTQFVTQYMLDCHRTDQGLPAIAAKTAEQIPEIRPTMKRITD